jgi:hypothetical protein
MLKQSEIFSFLAIFFLLGVFAIESDRRALRVLKEQLEDERRKHPPIVLLSESREDFRFPLGSAEPTVGFREAINQLIVPLLDSLGRECQCDGIEIIGHTDGVRVASQRSDLDDAAVSQLNNGTPYSLTAGSNVDLGLMRALAVMQLLRKASENGKFGHVRYWLPYSAGQLILPDRSISAAGAHENDLYRRRIEIRLLRISTSQEIR